MIETQSPIVQVNNGFTHEVGTYNRETQELLINEGVFLTEDEKTWLKERASQCKASVLVFPLFGRRKREPPTNVAEE